MDAHEAAVLVPLVALQRFYAREADVRLAEAATAAHQALIASLISGILALLGGVAFVLYALRLVRRLAERETKLQRSDRHATTSMMLQVRTTALVLGGVAIELRAAARRLRRRRASRARRSPRRRRRSRSWP